MKVNPEKNICPDAWVILEIEDPIHPGMPNIQKVLSGWSGGYLDGDAWRLSSPIKQLDIKVTEDFFEVQTESGSSYKLSKHCQGLKNSMSHVYNTLTQKFPDRVSVVEL